MHRDATVLDERAIRDLYVGPRIYRAPSERDFLGRVDDFAHVVDDVAQWGLLRGDVLDVGCNAGYALKAFEQRGWSPTGVEQNEETAAFARTRLNGPVLRDVAELTADRRFDVILLSHIIEHIPDPLAFLLPLVDRLRARGVVYVKVPNYGSRTVRYGLRGRWTSFLPGQHVWYFDASSLTRLMQRAALLEGRTYTREFLSYRSRSVFRALVKSPLAAAQRILPGEGFELVGVFLRDRGDDGRRDA